MANKREGHRRGVRERAAFPLWALASGQYPLFLSWPVLLCLWVGKYHPQVAAQLLLCVSQKTNTEVTHSWRRVSP